MAIVEGVAALKSLKSLYELAREVRQSGDPERLRAAAAQIFDLALAAREQTAALQERYFENLSELQELRGAREKAKKFAEQSADFTRKQIGGGGFVYVEKESAAGERNQPPYCANCFGKEALTIMQPKAAPRGFLECPECGSETH